MMPKMTGVWEGWSIDDKHLISPTGRTFTPDDIEPHYYTQAELAKALGVSKAAIGGRISRGTLPPFDKGKTWLTKTIAPYIKIAKGETNMIRVWERERYTVESKVLDHDLQEFDVVKDGEVVGTITPSDLDDQDRIIADLDDGADVNGWEDGMGNTITI